MPKKLLILNAELMHYPYAFTSLIWSVMAFVGSAGKDSFSFFFLMCFVLVSSFSLYTYSGCFFTSYFCFKNFSFYCQIEKLPFSPCSFLLKIVWVFLGGALVFMFKNWRSRSAYNFGLRDKCKNFSVFIHVQWHVQGKQYYKYKTYTICCGARTFGLWELKCTYWQMIPFLWCFEANAWYFLNPVA